ncbi:MAG: hypothetical protein WC455_02030 [Dehalococcoidia bacterium]
MDQAEDKGVQKKAGKHPVELPLIRQDKEGMEYEDLDGKIHPGKGRHKRDLPVDGETEISAALRFHLEAVDEEVGDQPEQGAQYQDGEAQW